MLKVGITGGIGSGKSIVSQMYSMLGIPVYYADKAARELMDTNEDIRRQLIHHFGEDSYRDDKLNRSWIAEKVFSDSQQLAVLNSIVHPVVLNEALVWLRRQNAAIVMKEAAIFFEAGSYQDMDLMIGVYSPLELRITRTMKRDRLSRGQVMERVSRQMDEEEKMARCDFVLYNNEEQLLIPQVLKLHEVLLKRAEAAAKDDSGGSNSS